MLYITSSCQYKHSTYRDFLNRENLRTTRLSVYIFKLEYEEIRGACITHTYVGFVKTFAACKAGV